MLPFVPPGIISKALVPKLNAENAAELHDAVECVKRLPLNQRNGVQFFEVQPEHARALLNAGYALLDGCPPEPEQEPAPPPTNDQVVALKLVRNVLRSALGQVGEGVDEPEGTVNVQLSATLAVRTLHDVERALGERESADVVRASTEVYALDA